MKNFRKDKGITLIALVVTIVVLLILAGITISTLFGDNGIISAARKAADDTIKDQNDTEQAIGDLKNEMNEQLLGGSSGLKASQIASEPSKYYGQKVNYTAGSESFQNSLEVEWKIFYADENHIYLIASDYIPKDKLPASTNASGTVTTNKPDISNTYYTYYPKGASFNPILNDYTGSARVSENVKYLNKSYFDYLTANSTTSTNDNMKAVAYMLDTKAWEGFKDSTGKADFVIGGPTVEMLFDSYCKKNNFVDSLTKANKYQARVTDVKGYEISNDYGKTWNKDDNIVYVLSANDPDQLYAISTQNPDQHFWDYAHFALASPSARNYTRGPVHIVRVAAGSVEESYATAGCGFRPLVCLKSNVGLVEQQDSSFYIK